MTQWGKIGILFAASTVFAFTTSGRTVELKVISSVAYKPALNELVPKFEKVTGDRIVVQYDVAAVLIPKIKAGEEFDVAILSSDGMQEITKLGIALEGSSQTVGVSVASLAYKRGTTKPEISTPDALKAVLLDAKAISFSDPARGGASSVYFADVTRRLGIAEEVQRKSIVTKAGEGAVPVSEGRAEFGAALSSEIAMVPGVDGVPIFPVDPRSKAVFAAGVSSHTKDKNASEAFVSFMISPEVTEIRKSKGLAAD